MGGLRGLELGLYVVRQVSRNERMSFRLAGLVTSTVAGRRNSIALPKTPKICLICLSTPNVEASLLAQR